MTQTAFACLLLSIFLALPAAAQDSPAADDVARLEARLAELEKALSELAAGAAAASGEAAAKQSALEAELAALRDELASKEDLKRYVRKPDESQFKSRTAQELELRGAFTELRQDEIAALEAAAAGLAAAPGASERTRALAAALGGVGELLHENDARARPRLLLRLTWEASRFIDASNYLFVEATPELALFVYDQDLDRILIPRDAASPRDRLGIIFKKAAAGVKLGRVGLQAGVLQFTYGSGFFVNPTNLFTPKTPLDPRREVDGVPAAKLDLSIVQREGATLSAQLAAVGRMVRNDLVDDHGDALQVSGLAMVRLDTRLASISAIGIAQAPDELGRDEGFAFGGILSANPFGLTASVEALWSEQADDDGYRPELVASIQGFTPKIGANGTTYIVEYLFQGGLPATRAEAEAELAGAIVRGDALLAADRLMRPLGRRHYANVYLEPSITQRLRVNVAALVGFDEAPGALARAGFDYDLYNFTIHAFGGVTLGADESEFHRHLVGGFAELAVFASF